MAESEATTTVRGTAADGGDGTGARMVGGSLPPRKRLLAGLKQNGLWLASSSPASASALAAARRPDGGATVSALRSSPSADGPSAGEAKGGGGCMSCGTTESVVWKKAKGTSNNAGVPQRICEFCNLSLTKISNCPRCQRGFADVKDPAAALLECGRCQRSVHLECEQRASPQVERGSYVCQDCVHLKDNEDMSALRRPGAPSGRFCSNSSAEAGKCAAECSTPSSKKSRTSSEPCSKPHDAEPDDRGNSEEIPNSTLSGRKCSSSKEAAAAAAAAAATLAARAAVAAKAAAAAKAATAVRAAAMAKAALNAAALAARLEAQVRAELRRNSLAWERTSTGEVKVDAALCQLRKGRAEETEVKTEGVEIPAGTKVPSVDDVEVARQLHRAINSSPRISSGLTPLRRKPSSKPVANTPHAITSWPHLGLSTEAKQQQQIRPRSLQPKEAKLNDSQDVKLESKLSGGNVRTKSTGASGNTTEPIAPKSEFADSSTVTLVRQDSGNALLQNATSAPSTVASNTENDRVNGTMAASRSPEDCQDQELSAPEVSQAAALLDEVLMSEADQDGDSKEEYISSIQDRAGVHLKEDLDAPTMMIIEGTSVVQKDAKDAGREPTEGGVAATANMSGVAALVQVASSAMASLENQDKSSSASAFVDGDHSLEDSAGENVGQLTV